MTNYISKINNIPIGGNQFDSNWVIAKVTLLSNAQIAGNTTTYYDLSSYLPTSNENCNYEVIGWVYMNSSQHTTSDNVQPCIQFANGTKQFAQNISSDYSQYINVVPNGGGTFRLIIPSTDRRMCIINTRSVVVQAYCQLTFYRKIGVNA